MPFNNKEQNEYNVSLIDFIANIIYGKNIRRKHTIKL